MAYQFRILRNAELAVLQQVDYLETQGDTLGTAFQYEFYKALQGVCFMPKMYRERENGIRVAVIKPFRHIILYTINEEQKRVIVENVHAPGADWQTE